MRHFLATGLALAFTPAFTTAATVIGVDVGYQYWDAGYSGQLGRSDVDVESTLNWQDQDINTWYASLEHPVPVLPNIKLQQTNLETSGVGTIPAGTQIDDLIFPLPETALSGFELDNTDLTLYWELLDNVVSLDLGLTARWVEGNARIRGQVSGLSEQAEVDAVIPMGYALADIALPLGFSVGADINGLALDDNSLLDWRVQAGWTAELGLVDLRIAGGYRSYNLEIDTSEDLPTDLETSGPFLGLRLRF